MPWQNLYDSFNVSRLPRPGLALRHTGPKASEHRGRKLDLPDGRDLEDNNGNVGWAGSDLYRFEARGRHR